MAYNYHWAKSEILDNVYLDEALYYMREIAHAKLRGYLMDIAITSSPHLKKEDRQSFIRTIENQLRKVAENDNIDDIEPEKDAFEKLRKLLGSKKK